jgi:ATP-dependent DNA helicase RecQ
MNTPLVLLKKHFGYDSFRPMQEEIISLIMNKKDVLVLMPTGGGKSICFQIPALAMEGTCLVISPLIALMKDQVQGLRANDISAACLNSGLSAAEEKVVLSDCQTGRLKLLYLSPEKAIQLSDSFLQSFPVSFVAIDEAHCISQWGHDFRPEYAKLKSLRLLFPAIPFVALTATADKATRKDIVMQLSLNDPQTFVSSFDRPNLSLKVRAGVKEKDKVNEICSFINRRKGESGIIYCLSRNGTETLSAKLREMGIPSSFYHAGMTSEERSSTQEAFINDEVPVICATIAFGMGIDKSNVRWVLHYNLPRNMEGYYQEIGRAGRDGLPSDTLLYYNLKDLILLTRFAKESGQPELSLEKLKRIQQYAEARVCRRKILLSYFGEARLNDCGNCDACLNPPAYIDGTIIAQKALSAILRLGEKTGTTMLIHVLRGSQNGELLELGYHKIKTYGAGKDLSFDTWSQFMLQLLQIGLIDMAYDEGFALKVTPYGKQVLNGLATIQLVNAAPPSKEKGEQAAHSSKHNEGSTLFDQLRKHRKELAEKTSLPPYVIFHDKTLREMAEKMPRSAVSMLEISGVSEKKFEKYGAGFIAAIRAFAGEEEGSEKIPIEDLLASEKLDEYIRLLSEARIPPTPQNLGKILLASGRMGASEVVSGLSCYGILRGRTVYKSISEQLKAHFDSSPVASQFREQDTSSVFFDGPLYNNMQPGRQEKMTHQIKQLEILRPDETITNEYILEQRKTFQRSYEPWSEEELTLFRQALDQTNDLDIHAQIFLRNPGSIRAQYKKMKSVANAVHLL